MNGQPKIVERELRNFGLVVGAVVVVLFGAILPALHRVALPIWPWSFASILWISAFFYPTGLRRIHKIWMTLGKILGWLNTRLILSLIFFIIITPIGFLMRIFGYDSLRLKKNDNLETYRIIVKKQLEKHMGDPF